MVIYPQKSSLVDFLSILREVFAKEPPVRYKQPQVQRPQQQEQVQMPTPPPLPPLPPELGSPATPALSPQATAQMPPPRPPQLPPKPGQVPAPEQHRTPIEGRYESPPPLPPLPPKEQDPRRLSSQHHVNPSMPGNRMSQYLPERGSNVGVPSGLYRPTQQHMAQPMPAAYPQGPVPLPRDSPTPVSPVSGPPIGPPYPTYGSPQQAFQHHPPQQIPKEYQQIRPQYQPTPPRQVVPPSQRQQLPPPTQPAAVNKTETPDLLTSPFELGLPSFAPSGPPPPIPPNPEKDALLHAISKTLAETLQSNASQSNSAAQSLISQSHSLQTAIATLQGEITTLNTLNSTLQSNTSILQQSLHQADAVIADAQTRISSPIPQTSTAEASSGVTDGRRGGLPPIDDVLVAPTVVGKQLYDLVAEERGIQQAIYSLQAALVKGVIGVEAWSRHTRGLAREAFLKRALIKKIGKGMGLEESD